MKPLYSQRGISLIEIMIALGLGVFITFGLIQTVLGSKQLSQMETALSRVQETGRFSLDEITKDIRMTGYVGCADPNNIAFTIMATDLIGPDYSSGTLRGFEVASSGIFSPALNGTDVLSTIQGTGVGMARPGSDVIFVQQASVAAADLLDSPTTGNDANINIDSNPTGLSQGDYAILSDCNNATIFEITNVIAGVGTVNITHARGPSNNTQPAMTPTYSTGAQLLSMQNRTYFVADTGRNTSTGSDVYALYVKEFANAPQEILEGVESLQLEYGEQLATGNIRYVTAPNVTDMNNVVTVRVGVLVQSFDQVANQNDSNSYALPGATITGSGTGAHQGDRALRKPFVTTVRLRNRRLENIP